MQASPGPAWADKYKVIPPSSSSQHKNTVVYDFSSTTHIPTGDLAAVQAIEAKGLCATQEDLVQAEKSKYRIINMPKIPLWDGTAVPAVGLGTWKADKGQVRTAVRVALQAGYRHIDCASVYQNEDEVGEALEYVVTKGLIPREELYICSKVWNNDHAAARVRAACLKSLKALKLSYLDLYLIHWPISGNVGPEVVPSIRETWQALEQLVEDGLVRSIGTSNFSSAKLKEILTYAKIRPAVCQVEIHPYHRNTNLINWCRAHNIHVMAFSPLGSPDSESIFPRKVPAVLLQDPVVHEIAKKNGVNVGQVLIRWALQNGTSVIPKSTNPDRIAGNVEVLDWELPEEDFVKLSSFKFQQRMVNGAILLNEKGPYRTLEELWDEPECVNDDDGSLPENQGEEPVMEKVSDVQLSESPLVKRPVGGMNLQKQEVEKKDNKLLGRMKNWLGGK